MQATGTGVPDLQLQCVRHLLHWKGPLCSDGSSEEMDVNAFDKDRNTALHIAAASGHFDIVDAILDFGGLLALVRISDDVA